MQLLNSGWARFGLIAGLTGSAALCGLGADTAFRYQGFLGHASQPAAGLYDFTFSLHTTPDGLEPLGSTLTNAAVTVQEGRFTTELDFGTEPLNGQTLWLEIGVRPSSGDESFQTLTPRQQLTSAPYAVHALGAQNAAVADVAITVPPASVTALQIAPDTITGDHLANDQVVRSLNGLRDDLLIEAGDNLTLSTQANSLTLSGSFDWRLSGNSDTLAGKHFIGTLNAQPLEFKVNGNRALRLEPTPFATVVNVVGGSSGNFVRPGTFGCDHRGWWRAIPRRQRRFHQCRARRVRHDRGRLRQLDRNQRLFGATITGGHLNSIQVWAYQAVIGGGSQNQIGKTRTAPSSVGVRFIKSPPALTVRSSTVAFRTSFPLTYSSVGGGSRNASSTTRATPPSPAAATIFIAANSFSGAIGGGGENEILADSHRSTIAGGKLNRIGTAIRHTAPSAAATRTKSRPMPNTPPSRADDRTSSMRRSALPPAYRAQALHPGSFVWADAADHDFATTNANEFAVRAGGGVRFVSAVDDNGDSASGVLLEPGEGSWSTLSDRAAKMNFAPIQPGAILEQVVALPIQTWSYQGQLEPVRHLGPVAQDFHAAFGLGSDSRRITTVDADGVALAAIQGLHEMVREKSERITALEARNAELLQRLVALEERFNPAQ
jgi:trimeric autotransporter adhesin